jgi:uncharacterized protein YbcC (UPF0753/DUF2309 family)
MPDEAAAVHACPCEGTDSSGDERASGGEQPQRPDDHAADRLRRLEHAIEHASHLLPSQGPIRIFVHHNTLHAFEHLSFHEAVKHGGATYGCHPYLPEDRYREKLSRGRILFEDLAAVLMEDLGDDAEALVGFLGTRYHLRLAVLQHPLRLGPDSELRWLIAETDALRRFRSETPFQVREQMIERTRRWVMRDLRSGPSADGHHIRETLQSLFERFGENQIEHWSPETWEAFTLHALWRICHRGVHGVQRFTSTAPPVIRHRDLLLQTTGVDSDRMVHDVLIRFCAAFLDQGVASWPLPVRDRGFFKAFLALYKDSRQVDGWLRGLPAELRRIEECRLSPLDVIDETLRRLGVADYEMEEYLTRTLLALRGWAGMLWQMETNAEWVVHPAPRGTLVEYVAVRLLLLRLAIEYIARTHLHDRGELTDLRSRLRRGLPQAGRVSVEQRTFLVFQVAQILGWIPGDLNRLSKGDWSRLVEEIEGFSGPERRRIYHLAFERRYRHQTLDAFLAHGPHTHPPREIPRFQVCCCLDEREESFRRHLEEANPSCETFGFAGFFAVAMYYRGAVDAHFVPLSPILIKPRHYVQEEVVFSLEESHRVRTETRRAIGKASHQFHIGSRSGLAGALASILGSLASIPLVARVVFPRLTAQIRRTFGSFVQVPPVTRLILERSEPTPGPENGQLGYSLAEMIDIVERVLRDIGLTARFSRLAIIMGHGSSSLNNPHKSAYDCGACGGGRGGPNARAYAQMANDPRVREALAKRGVVIPPETVFIGALHNTCDDSMAYFDLDRLPTSHRADFQYAKLAINEARRRNAHERCRRFESAELSLTLDGALKHVEGRSEDLAQARPECGHATNAICYVGRRWRTQGLYLDRRTFLTSYDPTQDDANAAILTRILQAAIPVCAGINLEYYFSYVDPTGYGCGTKLPHNITSLIGVMDGAASDLRTGLPWQMVEIHEPMRILFIIESTPEAMLGIIESNPAIQQLVVNDWVQLALLDPNQPKIKLYRRGAFHDYHPETHDLPVVQASVDWYRGWRDHLGYASVVSAANHQASNGQEAPA